jgi:ABC-2 type transport system permease protein
MVGSLGQPLLFLLALGFGFGPTFSKAGGGSYIQYLAPGVMAMGILFTAVFTGIEIIWDRQFGFLKETLVAPISRLQIMLGRTLGGATVALLQGMVVFVICLLAGFRFQRAALLPVAIIFMFLIAVLFTAIGTAIASNMQDMQGFQLVMNFLVMPLFFFSNALFPVSGLPKPLRAIIHCNPLTYGIDGMRGSFSNNYVFSAGTDFIVLGALTAILLAIGSYFFSKIQI